MNNISQQQARSRALAIALEPVAGSVYFAPEAHDAYAELGFSPSPGVAEGDEWAVSHWGAVQLPDGLAYFASRGGILGRVRGEVVAAAFGVFNPEAVVAAIDMAWSITDPDHAVAARDRGAIAQLERILGSQPDGLERVIEFLSRAVESLSPVGRPMFAGLAALEMPGEPIGVMWRLGDTLREFRGDAHISAAAAAGYDGCQLQVLTERAGGMPPRSYAAGRAWSASQLQAAEESLRRRGLLDGDAISAAGLDARQRLEAATDDLCAPAVDTLGDDLIELIATLQPWGAAIREANGYYPSSPQEAVLDIEMQEWMCGHGLDASPRPST